MPQDQTQLDRLFAGLADGSIGLDDVDRRVCPECSCHWWGDAREPMCHKCEALEIDKSINESNQNG